MRLEKEREREGGLKETADGRREERVGGFGFIEGEKESGVFVGGVTCEVTRREGWVKIYKKI